MTTIRVFVRQPFTESGNREREIVQGALDVLRRLDGRPYGLSVPTGFDAQSQETFRQAYERDCGRPFTPQNFRTTRLGFLDGADAMFIVRTSLSESGSFEVAYNIFGGRRVPMFFAVWEEAPIRTTLLRDLEEIADATYVTFRHPNELEQPLAVFLEEVARARRRGGVNRFPWQPSDSSGVGARAP
jgi:carbamoyl-phosphate synthase large subunit